MNRRGFLGAILAAGVAPVYIKYGSLMPLVKVSGAPAVLTLEMSWIETPILGSWYIGDIVVVRNGEMVRQAQFTDISKPFNKDGLAIITRKRPDGSPFISWDANEVYEVTDALPPHRPR